MNASSGDLTRGVAEGVARAIEAATGIASAVVGTDSVSGGCVNDARVLTTRDDRRFFLKRNPAAPAGFFEAEADGLATLAGRSPLRVPEVLACGVDDGYAWLLLEFIPPGNPTGSYWAALGDGLAALHASGGVSHGFERDNFIGPLFQTNEPEADWAEFWISQRLLPQLDLAHDSGLLDRGSRLWREIPDAVRSILSAHSRRTPSMLHGDLWSGNVFPDEDGRPVIIDPAVYRGDSEVDLAMADLFGGFGDAFYAAYGRSRPLDVEYHRVRRDLYQLYPLLVHTNLFGASYASSATATARRIVEG